MKVIDGGRSAKTVAEVLTGYEFHFSNEEELQAAIAEVLTLHGIPFEKEVELYEVTLTEAWKDRGRSMETPHIGRIDFMVGSVGIEVKVGFSWADVVTQLHRYAQAPAITDLILVTTRMQHVMPPKINDKPLTVINLGFTNSL